VSLRTTIIKKLVSILLAGGKAGSIEAQRARQERTARFARLPTDIQCQPVVADSVPAEWIKAPDASRGAILYLHGGAYVLGSINTHRELVARLVRATKAPALIINYRLAPKDPYPAALEDATTAYLWLLDRGIEPSTILLAGDSAGGGLALATLVALRDAGESLPAGAVCISPWTDLALTGGSIRAKARADPILAPSVLETWARTYAGTHDLTDPMLSPLYADFGGLPPLLIQVGRNEILLDDAVRCAEMARQAGVEVTLEVWEGMFHVFHMLPFLPETKEAIRHIAGFVTQRLMT